MGRRRKALQSSLELMENQCFRSLSAIESFRRLARTIRDQLVTGECMKLLSDVGEEIQAWACYSDFAYRHPEEWPVYMDEREREAVARLLKGNRKDDRELSRRTGSAETSSRGVRGGALRRGGNRSKSVRCRLGASRLPRMAYQGLWRVVDSLNDPRAYQVAIERRGR